MSALRHLLAVFCCLSLACSSTSTTHPAASAGKDEPASIKLRLASSKWPPWLDTEGNPRVAIDLVSTALARAGYAAVNEITPLGALLDDLRAGGRTYDGSAGLWHSDERAQYLLYSKAYLENRMMLVGSRGSDVSATSFAQLQGKKIGVVKDYAYGPELDNAKGPVFVRGESSEANLRAVLHGELDYAFADALVVHQMKQLYPHQMEEKLAVGTTPLITRPLYFAVRKNLPDAQRIVDRFNEQLGMMLKDGSYHAALQVDWILADVDGDGTPEMVAAGDKVGVQAPKSGYQLVSLTKAGATETAPANAKFVVKGVPYDTWDTVPDYFKTPPNTPTGTKPGTLRATVFEF